MPHHIRRRDGGLFAFAGIFDRWKDAAGTETRSFAIVTTAADDLVAQIHNRMPVILEREQEEPWLATAPEKTDSLLKIVLCSREDAFEIYPVSRLVNWPKNDAPDLIRRLVAP